MERRHFLAAAAAGVTVSAAGCVEAFESLDGTTYGREPPLVANRPNAIYWPTHTEQMHHGEVAETDDGLAVHLMYTFPHRFWFVESGDEGYGTRKREVGPDDAIHLMVGVWDAETEVVLPVSSLDVAATGGDGVDERETIYPMLSQRMGFHYGDNYHLDGDDSYEITVTIGGVDDGVERFGAFVGRFAGAETLELQLEYSETERNDLEFELYEDRQGQPGAVAPMGREDEMESDMDEMGDDMEEMDHDGHDMHHEMPLGFAPDLDEAGGQSMGEAVIDDIRYRAALFDADRFGSEPYLVVTAATRHNDLIIPELDLSVAVGELTETTTNTVRVEDDEADEGDDDEEDEDSTADGGSLAEEREIEIVDPDEAVVAGSLTPALDPELGFHYGISAPELMGDEQVTVAVTTPTQVVRHEGYETVFFDTPTITLE